MPIRVGIDISSIQYNRGVSRYTSNLVMALYKQKKAVLRLFGTSFRNREILRVFAKKNCSGCYAKILPHPVKVMNILWNDLHMFSPERVLGNIDVFHSWELQPPLLKARLVSTIHDLAMLKYPKTADPYVLSMHEQSWKHLKKEASAIIAVSHSTKKDMIELLGMNQEKIHVVYEALPQESKLNPSVTIQQEVLSKLSLLKPFIFFVGVFEPRKNLPRLIEAWRRLKKDFELVLVGAKGWESIQEEQGLRIFHSLSQLEIAVLYKQAGVFVYPSLYEGFGLPILEAFFHKTPVVTSDISSMPEVGGSAVAYCDPLEVASIQKAIEKAIHQKKYYVKKGLEQLQQFNWDATALKTVDIYERVRAL